MNKAELIRAISDHSGTTRLMAERMLNAFTATVVSECSKGHEVKIVGFGSFFAPVVNKRAGRNPKTGAEVVIDEHRRPRFTAGTGFKTGKVTKEDKGVRASLGYLNGKHTGEPVEVSPR